MRMYLLRKILPSQTKALVKRDPYPATPEFFLFSHLGAIQPRLEARPVRLPYVHTIHKWRLNPGPIKAPQVNLANRIPGRLLENRKVLRDLGIRQELAGGAVTQAVSLRTDPIDPAPQRVLVGVTTVVSAHVYPRVDVECDAFKAIGVPSVCKPFHAERGAELGEEALGLWLIVVLWWFYVG